MSMKHFLKPLAMTSVLITATLMAQTPYDEGQKALREQRWMDAVSQFEEASKSSGESADAATYWQAYALYKAGRSREAERTLDRLERKYPDSEWIREARALRIENDGGALELAGEDAPEMDEELKLFALAQLMDSNPDRAVPLLLDLVHNGQSAKVRRDALFVLAISENPEALQTVAEVAANSSDPDLQVNAIHILGSAGNLDALPMLRQMYEDTTDQEVKKAVIHAAIAADDPQFVLDLMTLEDDVRLKREMIHALGAMGASEALTGLYPSLQDESLRIAAIEAFSIDGNTAMLRQVLETESDPKVHSAALQGIAIEGGPEATEYLRERYFETDDAHEKRQILDALLILDDADELAMTIVRSETDPDLQSRAILALGLNGNTAELVELYSSVENPVTRKAVLEAMSISGDSRELMDILRQETDPELRASAINYLAVTGDAAVSAELVELYPRSSDREKSSIIQAMLIMDDTEGLIGLLKQEDDPKRKREMIQVLTVMDSEQSEQYLFELLEQDR